MILHMRTARFIFTLLAAVSTGCATEFNPTPTSAEKESLSDVIQLTTHFDRAGEAYFSRDMRWIIFQASPPGEPNYESNGTFAFKEDSHIESLHPHMHVRGKDFLYKLVYPDGTSKVLLWVPRYDFAWQLTYFFKEPVAAPKGSRLEVVAHHDNSLKNKYNPDPTREVRWGDQTWDEMMIGYLDYTVDKQDLRRTQPQDSASRGEK